MKKLVQLLTLLGAGFATYLAMIRPHIIRWGATDDEVQRTYPGDDIIPNANLISTHAVTIHAPPDKIWPWLVQIGNGRAGWYSFRFVERLVDDGKLFDEGASWRILPEFQDLQVGDSIPVGNSAFIVKAIQPDHYLMMQPMIGAATGRASSSPEPALMDNTSFGFVLEPIDEKTTRLIARARINGRTLPEVLFTMGLFEPGHAIMQVEMLRGIKARVEGKHHAES